MRRLLERLPRAYERLFSEQERAYCDGFSDPWPRYAARFAAKEAVGKALGIGIIGFVWREIEVLSGRQAAGSPARGRRRHRPPPGRDAGRSLAEPHRRQAYAVAAAVKEDARWMSRCCWACTPPRACAGSTRRPSRASASPAGISWSGPALAVAARDPRALRARGGRRLRRQGQQRRRRLRRRARALQRRRRGDRVRCCAGRTSTRATRCSTWRSSTGSAWTALGDRRGRGARPRTS